ncbi:LytR/AlgR family response regulator transcription factor [Dyadobacter frigoris]|uniref:Response regulator transcription factor n=1 Tax=Dyadobacter frigoris TaxID=2576211 RepID=A0A4V6BJ51_9BACT|nr:LytTR family DNA-binding domain-containing protein [Dyadobacter frigoris]TKT92253.1 response regulator transcription factor [Dyadobacter frigoris]GLU53432.1 DNA-binding response regulator [Dyadobacter frigoris]
MNISCIIVDDEPIAREIIKTYIEQVPYLTLAASCENAFEAMEILNKKDINLIILDINMPRLSGFEMLRSLKIYPAVIITSAYPEYALEGFELSVTDYLLKPFSFARFVQATEKIVNRATENLPVMKDEDLFLMVKSDKKLTKIFFEDISYVEAYGNYIFIHTSQERIMSKQTLIQFEQQLPASKFTRIHKSYIASVKNIKYIEGNEISIGGKKLPVGKVYRENLMRSLR